MLSVEPLRFVGESPQTNVHFETCSRTTQSETCSRTKKLSQGLWNLFKDKEALSRTLKLAQGQRNLLKDNWNLLKDIGTCQRTLELAKELWNVLKNFGICSRTSEVKLCLVLELASLELGRSHNKEYTDKFYNYKEDFLHLEFWSRRWNFFTCNSEHSKQLWHSNSR